MGLGGSTMLIQLAARCRARAFAAALPLVLVGGASPLAAQGIQTIDPDTAIDGDLAAPRATTPAAPAVYDGVPTDPAPAYPDPAMPASTPPATANQSSARPVPSTAEEVTYKEDDLIGAAEGVFGKGAQGLAQLPQQGGMRRRLLRMRVEPVQFDVIDARLQPGVDQLGNGLEPSG